MAPEPPGRRDDRRLAGSMPKRDAPLCTPPDVSSTPRDAPAGAGAAVTDGGPRPLGREDVAHVARLARLNLREDEIDLFTAQLRTVLEHAADVAALDLAHLEPSTRPIPVQNVLRPDEPRPSLDRAEVLAAAPSVEDDRFRVPRIGGEAP